MNYRHGYHAGNLADLFKHLVLTHLLVRLCEKDSPFAMLDTHAGAGSYDLRAEEALKTGEAKTGVLAFMKLAAHPALAPLQEVLAKWNLGAKCGAEFDEAKFRHYPGSPAIMKHYLRPQDRLVAVEKHPEEFKKLHHLLQFEKQAQLHERDGFEAMKALLPFPEKRGLVFIDPPYEKPDEMEKAARAILQAHARASTMIYALWYPLTDKIAVAKMKEAFAHFPPRKVLCCEAEYAPSQNPSLPSGLRRTGLKGCGMLLINPPWQIENALEEAFALLHTLFEKGTHEAEMKWLKE